VGNAPAGCLKEFAPLPTGVSVAEELQARLDWMQALVRTFWATEPPTRIDG